MPQSCAQGKKNLRRRITAEGAESNNAPNRPNNTITAACPLASATEMTERFRFASSLANTPEMPRGLQEDSRD